MELNKIYNQDCLVGMQEIPDKSIPMILTDIPYGKLNDISESGMRKLKKGDADSVTFDLKELVNTLCKKATQTIYMFCSTEQVSTIRETMDANGMTTRLCIWEKTNPSPMNGEYLWLSSVECCVFGRFPKATFHEFCKSPVWHYPCGQSNEHPTQKPVDLFRYIIRTSSNHGDTILDPFMGSGTTAIAAIREGRKFMGFEISEQYYHLANKRLRQLTGPFHLFGNIGAE